MVPPIASESRQTPYPLNSFENNNPQSGQPIPMPMPITNYQMNLPVPVLPTPYPTNAAPYPSDQTSYPILQLPQATSLSFQAPFAPADVNPPTYSQIFPETQRYLA